MSTWMSDFNPNKNNDGWETIEDTNLQYQHKEKDTEIVEEHQHYEVVIESPGVKEVSQKVVYDVADEATENYNNEATNTKRNS